MGAGKTTVGRKLASHFDYRFVDLDHAIEGKEQMRVQQIFETKGENYFREQESLVLNNLILQDKLVVATGGGTPCFLDNMEKMNRSGVTVYLRMNPEMLFRRLKWGRSRRPLITGKSDEELLAYIRNMLLVREPFYLKAQIVVEGKDIRVKDLSSKIRQFLQR